jgi:hypothetical protein
MKKLTERENIELDNGARLDLVPSGQKCASDRLAYIRFESSDGKYQGAIDRLPELKRLKKWVDAMIDSRKK